MWRHKLGVCVASQGVLSDLIVCLDISWRLRKLKTAIFTKFVISISIATQTWTGLFQTVSDKIAQSMRQNHATETANLDTESKVI
jgi:hypothetical protein